MGNHTVRWMFHSTAMVPAYDLALSALDRLCGLRVLEYSELSHPNLARRGGMTWLGDNSLEIGQPIIESAPSARFVAKTGGGMHSIALQVADLESTIRHLTELGIDTVRPSEAFCFSQPRQTGRVLFEWFGAPSQHDPRHGAVMPEPSGNGLLRVDHQAFVAAVVEDPGALAQRLSQILDTPVVPDRSSNDSGAPSAAVSLGDCLLALYPIPGSESMALWGVDIHQPRTHALGLLVEDLHAARGALVDSTYRIIRSSPAYLVLDPVTTGGVGVILTDRLLAGDPRSRVTSAPSSGRDPERSTPLSAMRLGSTTRSEWGLRV